MIEQFKEELKKIKLSLEEKLRSIRGHRFSLSFLENLEIEIYHGKHFLKSLGIISQLDPLTFRFEAFDFNLFQEIEKSLSQRKWGLSLLKERNSLIIKFPPLTEEMKKELLKTLSHIKEETRIRSRQSRDEFLKKVKNKKERGDISEDQFYKIKEKSDEEIEKFNDEVEKIFIQKEKEILG